MTTASPSNRLSHESSPYLLQHAHNPVEWWPWCSEALQLARQQDKPILLSIGYSACHWCHVMAHESFEDAATAAAMNQYFINIKVDREERPDLDKIYQTAHQLLNQRSGGWPLTMFLTPDTHTPFFAGTYFPVQARYGMPAFKELLQTIVKYYQEHRDDLIEQHHAFKRAFSDMQAQSQPNARLNSAPLDAARRELEQHFDRRYGGFGQAPKFPHPTNLERLLRHAALAHDNGNDDRMATHMLNHTLSAMAHGGVYDQLGGGFYRYSVDDRWMIPHFEKMLYDNGPVLGVYADAYLANADPVYQRIVDETAQWTLREMQSPLGGYYSTLDADSEGHEGQFYLWTPPQVRELLTDEEYAVCSQVFGLDQDANFEGQWHLHVYLGLDELTKRLPDDIHALQQHLDSARQKLLAVRETRTHPGRDEKILTAWNALMIKGMATAARRLQRAHYIDSAQRAIDFIHQHLWRDGRLLANYKDGKSKFMAYLDDYAFLLDALLESLQTKWRTSDLHFAIQLADCLLHDFADAEHGGFYFTAHDHEPLLHRPKPMMDDALPAGNAIAALSLQRLGSLLANTRYLQAAEQTLSCAWSALQNYPHAHAAMLHALEEYLYPPTIIILRGPAEALSSWQLPLAKRYAPRQLCFAIPSDAGALPAALEEKAAAAHGVRAYLCQGKTCRAPIHDREKLLSALSSSTPVAS